MNCYMCAKKLNDLKYSKDYVCICNKCLNNMEKSEARMVKMVTDLAKEVRKDKIREEFLKWLDEVVNEEPEIDFVTGLQEENKIDINKQYLSDWAYGFYGGYKSRDKEIALLKEQNKEMFDFVKDISNILPWTSGQEDDRNRASVIIQKIEGDR